MLQPNIFDDFEGDRDMANIRVMAALIDGESVEIKVNRTDPYGLMLIEFQGIPTPEELSGSYTSYDQARDAVSAYVGRLPKVEKKKK